MNRSEIIEKRNQSWRNVEFLCSLKEQTKSKDKSIAYQELIKREKFKYKVFNMLLKDKK